MNKAAMRRQLGICPAQAAVVELLKRCNEPQDWEAAAEVLKCIGTCPAVAALDDADQAGEPDPLFWQPAGPEN